MLAAAHINTLELQGALHACCVVRAALDATRFGWDGHPDWWKQKAGPQHAEPEDHQWHHHQGWSTWNTQPRSWSQHWQSTGFKANFGNGFDGYYEGYYEPELGRGWQTRQEQAKSHRPRQGLVLCQIPVSKQGRSRPRLVDLATLVIGTLPWHVSPWLQRRGVHHSDALPSATDNLTARCSLQSLCHHGTGWVLMMSASDASSLLCIQQHWRPANLQGHQHLWQTS